MPNQKPLVAASALVAAFAAGAGADRIAAPRIPTDARPTACAISRDGYGLSVDVKAGAAEANRILNWDRNGNAPLLDGQVFDNEDARAIGACMATLVECAEKHVDKMSDALARSPVSK